MFLLGITFMIGTSINWGELVQFTLQRFCHTFMLMKSGSKSVPFGQFQTIIAAVFVDDMIGFWKIMWHRISSFLIKSPQTPIESMLCYKNCISLKVIETTTICFNSNK